MKFGYMGLSKPLETIWADGRKVMIYPDGRVVDLANNQLIREADVPVIKNSPQPKLINPEMVLLMLGVLAIIAIVAIVALSKNGK